MSLICRRECLYMLCYRVYLVCSGNDVLPRSQLMQLSNASRFYDSIKSGNSASASPLIADALGVPDHTYPLHRPPGWETAVAAYSAEFAEHHIQWRTLERDGPNHIAAAQQNVLIDLNPVMRAALNAYAIAVRDQVTRGRALASIAHGNGHIPLSWPCYWSCSLSLAVYAANVDTFEVLNVTKRLWQEHHEIASTSWLPSNTRMRSNIFLILLRTHCLLVPAWQRTIMDSHTYCRICDAANSMTSALKGNVKGMKVLTDEAAAPYQKTRLQQAARPHMVAGPAAAAAVAGRIAWREAIVNDMRLLASLRLFNPKLTLMSSRFDAVERDVGKVKYAWHARTGADLIPDNYLLYT
ncbi:hypothetical protein JKP88DRAFT_240814 [Tribonema minus]|uniref:Uncharacterized protein n=1 Tax=Tribonema minus TaxID=303371 RepID=A0A835Z294_9STRA|nr:hypothetical protein JKP88DRAFT_240814 [Tribonema minus]